MAEKAVVSAVSRAPGKATPNDRNRYEVMEADLPLHCPLPEMSLWDSHPRVYLPIEGTGEAKCPYCGADFILVERCGAGQGSGASAVDSFTNPESPKI